jgi:hypothetical protein
MQPVLAFDVMSSYKIELWKIQSKPVVLILNFLLSCYVFEGPADTFTFGLIISVSYEFY